jgi:predicted RNA-binding protein
MCEANAYLLSDGKEDLVLDAVDTVELTDDGIKMVNIFGEQKIIKARIKGMSLVEHRIELTPDI